MVGKRDQLWLADGKDATPSLVSCECQARRFFSISYLSRPSEQALVPALDAAVLDVTCELPLQVQPPAYLSLPVWDTHCPSHNQLDAGVIWAESQVAAGRTVLVHCAHGHGRSAAMLAAILIARGTVRTPEEAEALMRKHRPRVRLNTRQRRGVEVWAEMRHLKRRE